MKRMHAGGHHLGHEKEPPQPHGPKERGKHPPYHSHSARPVRKHVAKSGRKRPM